MHAIQGKYYCNLNAIDNDRVYFQLSLISLAKSIHHSSSWLLCLEGQSDAELVLIKTFFCNKRGRKTGTFWTDFGKHYSSGRNDFGGVSMEIKARAFQHSFLIPSRQSFFILRYFLLLWLEPWSPLTWRPKSLYLKEFNLLDAKGAFLGLDPQTNSAVSPLSDLTPLQQ